MNFSQKIGFSTNIFENPADIDVLVKQLSKDFKRIEIEFEKELRDLIDYHSEKWNEKVAVLNKLKEDNDLYYSVHAPYIGIKTDIANSEELDRIIAVDYLESFIYEAKKIGAEYITIHPGYLEFDDNGISDFDFQQLSKSIQKLSEVAKENGMTILLENTGSDREKYIVLSDEQHEILCHQYGVFLTLDIVHFESFMHKNSTREYKEGLKRILPYIRNAHFNDVLNGEHVHLPLDEGNFDYHKVLSYMVSEGYQGNFIIEESGGGFSPEEFIIAGKKYVECLNGME
ncbi:sugar phosphate isomerase/epimerase [Xenorhabdus sp. PB61.4]|uniref:sugar phosphate isomerase/epimerase family protein n=1 Tax=Xenorhabdus sp. PB61.4 TaxID=2788940 RepID=UPI001E3E5944|nr:sugar phosphate isomerase/epimerase family protein [Xenorhabdus sp. PB61.4]MCC8367267.1 sugar phosphate isomerase/epimerase [Xenorhabdus sp. PB61.4]